jgi:NNP family nitrate/nitrite transporter-like MFS transporter
MQAEITAQSHKILFFSTLAFVVCFAAWVINGVLITFLVNSGVFSWSTVQVGWLLGVPILVGSVMRLPIGLLADKFGGKPVMIFILLFSALPMFLLSKANDYTSFLILSFMFGLTGSSFAAGVAFTSLWYPRQWQGTALGIFGAGNAGAAFTTLFAPSILQSLTGNGANLDGWRLLPQLYAALLVVTALLFFAGTKNRRPDSSKTFWQRMAPLKEVRVWRFGLYYFFVFGSFVALAQWLIPYYVNVYSLTIVSAGFMATIFSLPTGLIRAAGGWLADKYGARLVLLWVFGTCLGCLFFLFVPRMEIQAPGQGVMAGKPGIVTLVGQEAIEVGDDKYYLQSAQGDSTNVSIRFGIHQNEERFLFLPTASFRQEAVVRAGDEVKKGQLLARGVTHIYFQANKWIFTGLIFLIGILFGLGGAAVYKHISDYYPSNIGAVGGIVGVLGGLGGFFNPIIFSYFLKATGVWTTCWMFLALIALVCIILQRIAIRAVTRLSGIEGQ